MNALRPEQIPPAKWDEKPMHDPRCTHCGFETVSRHGLLCIKCVQRLVEGLRMKIRREE